MKKILRIVLLIGAGRGFNRGLMSGIAQYASRKGPWTFYRRAPNYLRLHEAFDVDELRAWRPDGMICSVSEAAIARQLDLPVVCYDPDDYDGIIPCVTSDHAAAGEMAANHLLDLGHRHFAYCGTSLSWSQERCKSFRDTLVKEGYDVDVYPSPDQMIPWSEEENRVAEWVQSLPKPVALFCVNDDWAAPVMEICRSLSYAIPEDISVMGADDDEYICDLENPPLSSIRFACDKAGFEMAELLHEMIQGREMMSGQRIIAPVNRVATRQSTDVLMIRNPEVRKALRFIREHVNENIRVTDVVNATSLSHRYLNEQFHQEIGPSIGKYLARAKVDYICRLLTDTDMRIQEIAVSVGYEDDRHFARYFKRCMGVTPKEYRRNVMAP